ncbi:hypothetical protein MPSI1_001719 [Malassezia psittaci]|uniref:Transcription factor CBF/NF-Y/archaeal histone domain-containing protein n=1 Tax=Malassezia psittaci TaxID=1821823 RepID=A0AAF0F990_9BASI|nr:hypothetical protein MPSI1_001719 [Malassezia psittaci]
MVKRSVTSKFPIARIKRIMQADEDVGKVAQATPVVISKALELFMQDIVACAVEETRKSGGKRVAPYHLKRTTQVHETYDFLKDIVEKVPDPNESGAPRTSKRRKVVKAEVSEQPKDSEQEENDTESPTQTHEKDTGVSDEQDIRDRLSVPRLKSEQDEEYI